MQKTEQIEKNEFSFDNLGIEQNILDRLFELNFIKPTPIQEKSIPVGITGADIIGIAQTGTGKTLAFSIPMIQRIIETEKKGLIILPTRELAIQVDDAIKKIGAKFDIRTAVIIGGTDIRKQIEAIKKNPDIIIATPGRLNDHLTQKTISLANVEVLVLDEADRMLDMGFEPQIKKILNVIPKDRQTMLFSATMPDKIEKIAKIYMKNPFKVETAKAGTTAENICQEVFIVQKSQKFTLLQKLLNEHKGTVLVFSRTKHGARKITQAVRNIKHNATEIHSNRSLRQRQEAIIGFRTGKYRILVATDIASRGIDVKGIELVVNFDLPDCTEDYVHRIGRTARAGQKGKAISFAMPDQQNDIRSIERLIRTRLKVTKVVV